MDRPNDIHIRTALLLSVQRALLGMVPASLRAVTCDWLGTQIQLQFVFDGQIAEDDFEAAQIAGTEVIADFDAPWTITEDIFRLDYPADFRPSTLKHRAFMRKECNTDGGW
jgi:hypothetical protein